MTRDRFQVEGLGTGALERGEQPALARARQATDHDKAATLRQPGKLRDDVAAVGAIPAVELYRAPANFIEDLRQRPAALAAPPAIDQRPPVSTAVAERGFQHCGDIARNQCRPAPAGREWRRGVQRSDPRPLGVVEDRVIRRSRDVVLRELGRTAHVDAVAISAKRADVDALHTRMRCAHGVFPAAPSSGCSSRQTLSSSRGCAATTGWMRSGWKSALSSPKPSNRNGTSATWRALATSA